MDDKRAAEIRERLEAATPGPWKEAWDCDSIGPDNETGAWACGPTHMGTLAPPESELQADMALIAHAPADIAALLADRAERIKREAVLRKELHRERSRAAGAKGYMGQMEKLAVERCERAHLLRMALEMSVPPEELNPEAWVEAQIAAARKELESEDSK